MREWKFGRLRCVSEVYVCVAFENKSPQITAMADMDGTHPVLDSRTFSRVAARV